VWGIYAELLALVRRASVVLVFRFAQALGIVKMAVVIEANVFAVAHSVQAVRDV
jgi:hypothetical protein